jgi:hypothetical protein
VLYSTLSAEHGRHEYLLDQQGQRFPNKSSSSAAAGRQNRPSSFEHSYPHADRLNMESLLSDSSMQEGVGGGGNGTIANGYEFDMFHLGLGDGGRAINSFNMGSSGDTGLPLGRMSSHGHGLDSSGYLGIGDGISSASASTSGSYFLNEFIADTAADPIDLDRMDGGRHVHRQLQQPQPQQQQSNADFLGSILSNIDSNFN